MKKSEVQIGSRYIAKVSGRLTVVRVTGESPHGGWVGQNVETGRAMRIRADPFRRRGGPPARPRRPHLRRQSSRCRRRPPRQPLRPRRPGHRVPGRRCRRPGGAGPGPGGRSAAGPGPDSQDGPVPVRAGGPGRAGGGGRGEVRRGNWGGNWAGSGWESPPTPTRPNFLTGRAGAPAPSKAAARRRRPSPARRGGDRLDGRGAAIRPGRLGRHPSTPSSVGLPRRGSRPRLRG